MMVKGKVPVVRMLRMYAKGGTSKCGAKGEGLRAGKRTYIKGRK